MALRMFPFPDEDGRPAKRPSTTDAPSSLAECRQRFSKVAGLVFDMGDVLFDATAWRRWLLQLLGRMGLHASYRSFFEIWDRDYLDAVHCGRREYAEAFEAFLRDTGLTRGQIDEINAASAVRKLELESDVRAFPGVRTTLERLRGFGLRLAVLSDSESPSDKLSERLQRLGIGGLFQQVVSSADLGITKPAEACYQTALDRLKLSATQAAFVGHDRQELWGARRVGMPTIAFNFDRDAVAEAYLPRFDGLITLFERSLEQSSPHGKAA